MENEKSIEFQRFELEKKKFHFERFKWILIGFGAILTFWFIDRHRLNIEEFEIKSEINAKLMSSYLDATEVNDPELWKRKLSLIRNFSNDSTIIKWTIVEERYINEKLALLSKYIELIEVTSILVNKKNYASIKWEEAYHRFNQLFLVELNIYSNNKEVIELLTEFNYDLNDIQSNDGKLGWKKIASGLVNLSKILKDELKLLTSIR